MFSRKRCRYGSLKLRFLLFFLMLGFLLLMVTMLNPPSWDLNQEGISHPLKFNTREGYQLDFPETQEMVETQEESQQYYYPMEGLSPFISLREDELLVAIGSPTAKRNYSKARKGYRMVKQQSKRQEEKTDVKRGVNQESQLISFPLQDAEEADGGDQLVMLGLETHGFNKALSERIPLRRKLPEVRHPFCLQQDYDHNLPTASVIICFHDEAWSTLLRTVHSVMDTAPKASLKEIILVDDLSQQGHLKSALSEYISKLDGVKLIRSNKRLGVIRGRMLGAARATGDVLVFMDSHCECHTGWLEPLLGRLASDSVFIGGSHSSIQKVGKYFPPFYKEKLKRGLILKCTEQPNSPTDISASEKETTNIDFDNVIDWKTFQYFHSVDLQQGVFDWKLDFHWEPLPEREEKVRQSPISPIRSPVVPGGVVAVNRRYFQNIGAYDSNMTLWGAENLELSIRAWLCGGAVEILPCSRVGHIYQNRISHTFSNEEAAVKNKIRIAETWLDSFKAIFYKHNTVAFLISKAEKPDCNERLQLQKRLGCRNFHWFISNIYPELYPSEYRPRFSGKLYNTGVGFCADYGSSSRAAEGPIELAPCSDNINQHFEYNGMNEIQFGSTLQFCFDVGHEKVVLQNCTQEAKVRQQQWDVRENGMIVHILSGKCIEAVKSEAEQVLSLHACNKNKTQQWQFDHTHVPDER